jgi:2-haloacid dehalogenase
MRYSWILFDADGTLFDYDSAEAAALAETFDDFGHRLLPEHAEAYRQINGHMWAEFERGTMTQARLRTERFEALFESVGINEDPASFSETYLKLLSLRTELIDGAEEIVAGLAARARLMLITNGLADVQRPRFRASTIHHHFVDMVISEEVGAAKPDPRIFDAAFEIMGGPPRSQVLMVGDSLSSDIAGGNSYGVDTCWFNPSRAGGGDVVPTYEIAALVELIRVATSDRGDSTESDLRKELA